MKVVIIGAGLGGFSLIENFKNANFKIYLVEKENLSFRKYLFIEWLLGKVSDTDFFFSLENKPSLEIVRDRALRVNFEKKKVFLKEKEPLDFDKLILCCGLEAKRLLFPGIYKEGVYYLGEEPLKLRQDLSIYEHIIVYAHTLLGVRLAEELSLLKKQLSLIVESLEALPQEFRERIASLKGAFPLYLNSKIAEALGEGRVKAVKLSTGKFLACDILIIDSGYIPNLSLLKGYPDLLKEGLLKVDAYLRTEFKDCFACGDVVNPKLLRESFKNNKDLAQKTARIVASNLLELKEKFVFSESELSQEETS